MDQEEEEEEEEEEEDEEDCLKIVSNLNNNPLK